MRIYQQNASKLILSEVNGSLNWMLGLTFLGLLLITIAFVMGWKSWQEDSQFMVFPLVTVSVFGGIFIWIGIVQLSQRERLVLDKENRMGMYESTSSLLKWTGSSESFQWNQVECLEISDRSFSDHSNKLVLDESSTKNRYVLVLKLKDPGHSIVLDEALSGNDASLITTAEAVAHFLEVNLKERSHA